MEDRDLGADAGCRDGREVNDGIEPAVVAIAKAREGIDHLAVIGEVHLQEARLGAAGDVEPDHLVSRCAQLPNNDASELSGRAGHHNSHDPSLTRPIVEAAGRRGLIVTGCSPGGERRSRVRYSGE